MCSDFEPPLYMKSIKKSMIFFQNVKSSRQIGGCKKLLNEFPKEAIKTCYIVDPNNQFLHYLNGKHRP